MGENAKNGVFDFEDLGLTTWLPRPIARDRTQPVKTARRARQGERTGRAGVLPLHLTGLVVIHLIPTGMPVPDPLAPSCDQCGRLPRPTLTAAYLLNG
jgi:hypothetical protein